MYNPAVYIPTARDRAIDEAIKKENTLDSFLLRVQEIISIYATWSVQYQGMDATKRRYLAVTAPTTNERVRQMVYAKFLLAAILEWAPSNHNFSVQTFLDEGGVVYKTDAANELCPFWESFFDELTEAMALLDKVHAEPSLASNHDIFPHLDTLIKMAEVKAGWCESLLKLVATSTSTPGFIFPTDEAEIYKMWNQFCINVGNGVHVIDGAKCFKERTNILPKHVVPTPLQEATGNRIWFGFDLDGEQPWITHAGSILQQPHHRLAPKIFNGMCADEVHQWILDKTSDCTSNHYRCHTTSFCCSRLHVHCAINSPCHVWGSNQCPHARAGVACNEAHCGMVDWSKYNLCVPCAPDTSWEGLNSRLMQAKDYSEQEVKLWVRVQ